MGIFWVSPVKLRFRVTDILPTCGKIVLLQCIRVFRRPLQAPWPQTSTVQMHALCDVPHEMPLYVLLLTSWRVLKANASTMDPTSSMPFR